MKVVYFLRGMSGSGKSTWTEINKLNPYTLSADQIRLQFAAPEVLASGGRRIKNDNDERAWNFLFQLLEERMNRGDFTIVDATHYRISRLQSYRDLVIKYGYEAYVVDFGNVELSTAITRNLSRDNFRRVPESVINKMNNFIKTEELSSLDFIKGVISPEEALSVYNNSYKVDLSKYEKVVVFGDLHGCYSPLRKYFNDSEFSDKCAYVFVGDYIDRGIQNYEVMNFIANLCQNSNVFLLEGNHEKYLREYLSLCTLPENKGLSWKAISNGMKSGCFRNHTLPQIVELGYKTLSTITAKLLPFVFFDYRGKTCLVTHGGIPELPHTNISHSDYVLGAGAYEDVQVVYDTWNKEFPENFIMLHGHRNCYELPTKVTDRIYNLCSDIEYGAPLRIVEISEKGIKTLNYENKVFNSKLSRMNWPVKIIPTIKGAPEYINELNENYQWTKTVHQHGVIQYSKSIPESYKLQHLKSEVSSFLWDYKNCCLTGRFPDAKSVKAPERIQTLCYDSINCCTYLFSTVGLNNFEKTKKSKYYNGLTIEDFKLEIKQKNNSFFSQMRSCGIPGISTVYSYEQFIAFLKDNCFSMALEIPPTENTAIGFRDCIFIGFVKNSL